MVPHFIYCYGTAVFYQEFKKLERFIFIKMRKNGIQSAVLTTLMMRKQFLMTKEQSKELVEGKLKNYPEFEDYEGSINDDLDSFVNNLQNSEEINDEDVESFFTPKLTKEELKLVEQKNREHMMTYLYNQSGFKDAGFYADVGVEEMKKSDSKDKYVHSDCRRITANLSLELEQTSSLFDGEE